MSRAWKVPLLPLLLLALFAIAAMIFSIGYVSHDRSVMALALGWYIGVVMGCVTFYNMAAR